MVKRTVGAKLVKPERNIRIGSRESQPEDQFHLVNSPVFVVQAVQYKMAKYFKKTLTSISALYVFDSVAQITSLSLSEVSL